MGRSPRSNDKYDRIIDAAIRVFAKNGFYNSKVSEIAKEANVADGTIYLYFKNKDDILISLFENKMNEIIANLDERIKDVSDPLERIRIYIRSHFEMMREYHDLGEVITVELRQSSKFMKEYDNKQFLRYLKVLSDIIREGQNEGVISKSFSAKTMSRALFGMLDELSLTVILSPDTENNRIERMVADVSRFFIRGIKTRKAANGDADSEDKQKQVLEQRNY